MSGSIGYTLIQVLPKILIDGNRLPNFHSELNYPEFSVSEFYLTVRNSDKKLRLLIQKFIYVAPYFIQILSPFYKPLTMANSIFVFPFNLLTIILFFSDTNLLTSCYLLKLATYKFGTLVSVFERLSYSSILLYMFTLFENYF